MPHSPDPDSTVINTEIPSPDAGGNPYLFSFEKLVVEQSQLYQIGTKVCIDYVSHVFNYVVDHAESYAVHKPIAFPSLIFGIIQSQHNVVKLDDVYESEAPLVVMTSKLRNVAHHINDMSDDIPDED